MGRQKDKTLRVAVKDLRTVKPTMTGKDIAISLHVSLSTVYNILKELQLPKTPRFVSPSWRGNTAKTVVKLRKANPCAKLQDIADKVGVTRERVRQILGRDKLPTRHYVQRRIYECLNCGKPSEHRKYCSPQCRYEYTHPLVDCDECHTLFRCSTTRIARNNPKNHLAKYQHLFCSKKCQGLFTGKHYGFIAHPDNIRLRVIKRKYDYNSISAQAVLLHEQGLTSFQIATQLSIPLGTLFSILQSTHTRLGHPHHYRHRHYSPTQPRLPVQHIRVNWLKHLNFTDREIKQITGCSKATLYRAIYLPKHKQRVKA